jgi:hypothetical protein
MNLGDRRRWIARLLTAAAICAIIAAVAGVLQSVLSATGDADGASAVRGVLLVAGTGIGLSLAALVVVVALIELHRDDEPPHT